MRVVLYLLVTIFLVTFLRYVIGAITQAFARLMGAQGPSTARSGSRRAPTAGELRKDPVCGTFVATSSSVKETVGGEIVHFCSAQCRDKYRQGPRG